METRLKNLPTLHPESSYTIQQTSSDTSDMSPRQHASCQFNQDSESSRFADVIRGDLRLASAAVASDSESSRFTDVICTGVVDYAAD